MNRELSGTSAPLTGIFKRREVVVCQRVMRLLRQTLYLVFLAVFTLPGTLFADLLRTGPAEEPDRWPDWGGTPDLSLPEDIGLSEAELDQYLSQLGAADIATRSRAVAELIRDAAGSEAVFRKKLLEGHGARNTEMKAAIRAAEKRSGAGDTPEGLLKGLIAIDPEDAAVGNGATAALRILAMLHALSSLDTLAAYKVMIDFSPKHAGGFRHEIGKLIVSHGVDAMPALIYGRGNKDKNIHMFSVKWIRDMGNPLLSEQVKIKNPRRLAQLLEAYASVNDLDAIDVTLSLSNHSSSFVRAAARSALGHYGRNAFWPARRRYENAFGDEPDGTMEVEAILEALYTHFDNQRLKRSRELFEKGEVARGAGNFEEMAAAYKEVLKAEPMFPRRSEMARGFLDLAFSLDDEDQQQKQEAIALALRLAEPDSETARIAEAERLWLQAERLQEEGLAAMALYRRVLELSPDHAGAREMVRILSPDVEGQGALIVRAVPVSFVIFLGCVLIFMRLRTRA